MIKKKIQDDQIVAMKSGDRQTVEVLRYILAQIKNKEVDKKEELNEEEIVNVLRRQAKELNESIEAFEKGGRPELAGEYKKQLVILLTYLPQEISDEELQQEINKVIAAHQDIYQQNSRAIIGICVKELRSKADPSRITRLLMASQTK
ncbi:GatB/YqeY domain-containing protein [Candidatus Roizmanbacteria bacterium]|nr:GatB/YqeY domain-containing protein [Candidatus Roizmanbacteria bacterium]